MTSTISTFNVLHDLNKWVSPILQPQKRFSYIADKILTSTSDVYCLNEITPTFWPILISKVAEKYPYHSQPMIKSRGISVGILSKHPLKILFQRQSLIIAYTNNIIVVATHLVAYEQKYEARSEQMRSIVQWRLKEIQNSNIDKQIREAFENQNIIILGDLNLHLIDETAMIYLKGFYDSWIELEGNKQGYTWDPKVNKLIKWFLPYDNRRMRLDRILVKNGSKIRPKTISFDFNNKIPNSLFLFPSDHFGLTMTYQQGDKPYSPNHQEFVGPICRKRTTGFRSMKTIRRFRYGTIIAIIIALIILIKYVL